MNSKRLKNIYKKYKIICNNSVNYGDCYGDSYCDMCKHQDMFCSKCNIRICGCCYTLCYKKCPSCNENLDTN